MPASSGTVTYYIFITGVSGATGFADVTIITSEAVTSDISSNFPTSSGEFVGSDSEPNSVSCHIAIILQFFRVMLA